MKKGLLLSAFVLSAMTGLAQGQDLVTNEAAIDAVKAAANGNSVILHVRTEEEKAGFTSLEPGQTLVTQVKPVNEVDMHKQSPKEAEAETTIQEGSVVQDNLNYTVTEMPLRSHGKDVYGLMYHPKKDGKLPLVIISHRFGATHQVAAPYAEALAKAGYAVYIYDFRGGSLNSKSQGATTDMSIKTEIEDLEAVLRNTKHLKFVNNKEITLMGGSLGGLVTAAVGKRHDDDIKNMILLYPAFSLPNTVREQFVTQANIPESYDMFGIMPVGAVFAKDIWSYEPYQELKKFKKPVLILHGDKDSAVPVKYSEAAVKVLKNGTLEIIPEGEHGFEGTPYQTAVKDILAFLQNK